ncbi:hypothetical protein M1O16_04870 [Dehalococcoidia bacterium]|nr:hypothetical protein [Dehalococcoidia bacterium]
MPSVQSAASLDRLIPVVRLGYAVLLGEGLLVVVAPAADKAEAVPQAGVSLLPHQEDGQSLLGLSE